MTPVDWACFVGLILKSSKYIHEKEARIHIYQVVSMHPTTLLGHLTCMIFVKPHIVVKRYLASRNKIPNFSILSKSLN